jgi:hypothetical protein
MARHAAAFPDACARLLDYGAARSRRGAGDGGSDTVYGAFLFLHSWIRWLVLVAAVVAVGRGFAGWFGGRRWTAADDRAGLWFTIGLDLQLVLGLILYFFLSPFTTEAMGDFGLAMREAPLRFWAVEHLFLMLLAVVVVHVGRIRVRRASDAVVKHRRAAVFFTLALVLVVLGIPWPGMRAGRELFRLTF